MCLGLCLAKLMQEVRPTPEAPEGFRKSVIQRDESRRTTGDDYDLAREIGDVLARIELEF